MNKLHFGDTQELVNALIEGDKEKYRNEYRRLALKNGTRWVRRFVKLVITLLKMLGYKIQWKNPPPSLF